MDTMWYIRRNKPPLKTINDLIKKERYAYDCVYDTKLKLSVIKWNDNTIVSIIASKNYSVPPMSHAKRYNPKIHKKIYL